MTSSELIAKSRVAELIRRGRRARLLATYTSLSLNSLSNATRSSGRLDQLGVAHKSRTSRGTATGGPRVRRLERLGLDQGPTFCPFVLFYGTVVHALQQRATVIALIGPAVQTPGGIFGDPPAMVTSNGLIPLDSSHLSCAIASL